MSHDGYIHADTSILLFRYPTFARTVPAETRITKSLVAILKYYDWRQFTVIYESKPANTELFNAIKRELDTINAQLASKGRDERRYTMLNVTEILAYSEVDFSESNSQIIVV